MAVYFFDSSALVKRYAAEIGSNWVFQLTEPDLDYQIHVASITIVEVVAALARQARSGNISESDFTFSLALCQMDFADEYLIVELSQVVLDRAVAMAQTHMLRGYDAVQLAAALEIDSFYLTQGLPHITFVSADVALNAAAAAEGLPVDNPNDHGDHAL